MVKLVKTEWVNDDTKEVKGSVVADTKSEVESATIVGLPEGYSLAMGSDITTGAWDIGIMKSDGEWGWA